MKKKTIVLVAAAILVAAGLVSAALLYRSRTYEVVRPKIGDISEAVYGLGRVKSNQRFEIIIGVISTVRALHTEEGESVKKGDRLIEFDDKALFRAPFDGTVTLVKARPGETVVPHTPILRVENLRDRYIELSLEQQAALRVKKGQSAKVSFESLRGKILEGKVTALFPREDEFLAHVYVEGLEPSVLPGMTADVTVDVGKIQNTVLVPIRAVHNGMITMKRNGQWNKVKVEVGHVDEAYAEIKSTEVGALQPTDEIRTMRTN